MNDLKRTGKLPFLIKGILQTAPLTGVLIFVFAFLKAGCYVGLIYFLQSFIESLCVKDTFSVLGVVISLVTLFFLLALTTLMLKIFTKLASDALVYKFTTNMVTKSLNNSSLDSKEEKEDLIEEYQSLTEALARDITLAVFDLQAICNTLAIGLYFSYLFPPAVVLLLGGVLFNLLLTKSRISTNKELPQKTESENKLTAFFYNPDSLLEMKLFAAEDFFLQKWSFFEETLCKSEINAQAEEIFLKGQGDIMALLMYLVSLVVMGYYFFQGKVTFGSLIAIGCFGPLLQKEAIKALKTIFLHLGL